MSIRVEIFAGTNFDPVATVTLDSLVRPTIQRLLRTSLDGASIRISLLSVPDDSEPLKSPSLFNLVPDFGYAYVTVSRNGRVLYQHPHTIGDIVGVELQAFLKKLKPEEQTWGFRIAIPYLEKRTVRPTPAVEGVANVQVYAPGEHPLFAIRRVAEEPPPEISLDEFGVPPESFSAPAPVKVILPSAVKEELITRSFSNDVEEGGFLLGRVFREAGGENYLVEISGAENAEYTGASLLHFTFTGDSFSAVKQTLRHRHGEKLLGWYHTHLFAATDEVGLSSIDFRLHFETFSLPWQLAGLINIDGSVRVLRFYVRQGADMILCPVWVVDQRSVANR